MKTYKGPHKDIRTYILMVLAALAQAPAPEQNRAAAAADPR